MYRLGPSFVRALLPLVATLALGACGRFGVQLHSSPQDAGASDAAPNSRDAAVQDATAPDAAVGVKDAAPNSNDAGAPDAAPSSSDAAAPDAAVGVKDAASSSNDAGAPDAAPSSSDAGAPDAAVDSGGAPADASMEAGAPTFDAGADGGAPDAAPPAICGNAVVEMGEACDDGAGSATCDPDCTFASCGDGVLNALAGEQCDSRDQLSSCSAVCRVPECRTGCTCEFYRGVRYMFCAEQLAWEPARQACEQLGMRLLRVHSGTEQLFLRLRSQQYGYAKFQLGATDAAAEGTWRWTDGTIFWVGVANGAVFDGEFAAWAVGEPNAYVVGENCSEVQSSQGWNDCVCDVAKPFVCKETRDRRVKCGDGVVDSGEACDGGGETATCDVDCSPAVCGDGVVNATAGEQCDDGATGQYCSADCTSFVCPVGCSCLDAAGTRFAICSSASTFRDAGVSCGRAGMTLTRVDNSTVNQALLSAANASSIGEYWIGVFDLDQPDHWLRSDLSPAWDGTVTGTAHGYTNFTSTAPSGTTNRDCAAVLSDGYWQDRDCSVQKAYVCERL